VTADHPRLDRDVAEHYGARVERERLTSGPGRLEFVRTRELLARRWPAWNWATGGAGLTLHALVGVEGLAWKLHDLDAPRVALDNLSTLPKAFLTYRITLLSEERMQQVCTALAVATGC